MVGNSVHDVPIIRLRECNDESIDPQRDFVLYWMIAFRRTGWNFALQRAVEWANQLRKPLLVMEGLRAGYGWACDRLHAFILEGMADNERSLGRKGSSTTRTLRRRPAATNAS